MPGVTAAHLLRHVLPAAAPEGGKIATGLDRASGRRGQGENERHPALRHRRMLGEAEQSLDADRDSRPRLGVIIDRVAAAGRRLEMAGSETIDGAAPIPPEQTVERGSEAGRIDVAEPPP